MALTRIDYAILAANVYGNNPAEQTAVNTVALPATWENITPVADRSRSSGFMASAFLNGSDLVISYAGTTPGLSDWVSGNIPGATGTYLGDQVYEAAEFYLKTINSAKVLNAGKPLTVSFTGHSLGGGLASLMAVFFSKSAVVFDEAPFGPSARSPVVYYELKNKLSKLSYAIPQEYIDYSLTGFGDTRNTLEGRQAKVQQIYLQGEVLSANVMDLLSKINSGFLEAHDVAAKPMLGWNASSQDLHSITLLSSLIASSSFEKALRVTPELLATYFNGKFSRNTLGLSTSTPTLEISLLNAQIAKRTVNRSGQYGWSILDVIGNDFSLISASKSFKANAEGVREGIASIAKFVYNSFYYQITTSATQQLVDPISWSTTKTNFSIDLQSYSYNDSTEIRQGLMKSITDIFSNFGTSILTEISRWSFTGGTSVMDTSGFAWYSAGDSISDAVVGTSVADTLDTGAGADALYGGKGDDTLRGGLGDDTYYYVKGDGVDTIIDQGGNDTLVVKGVFSTEITKSKFGVDLIISVGAGRIVVSGFYLNQTSQIEKIQVEDKTLLISEVLITPTVRPLVPANVVFTGATSTSLVINSANISNKQYYLYTQGTGANAIDVYGTYAEYIDYKKSYSFTLNASSSTAGVTLSSSQNNDYVIGSQYNDTIKAGDGDFVEAGSGNDSIVIGAGGTVLAGDGDDAVTNSGKSTTLTQIYLGDGDDKFEFGGAVGVFSSNIVYGGAGNDSLIYAPITTEIANQEFYGGAGNDLLESGSGNDILDAGGGDWDRSNGGLGNDTYIYRAKDGRLQIKDSGGDDVLKIEGVSSTSIKFIETDASNPDLRLNSEDVDIWLLASAAIETIQFSDRAMSRQEYSQLMRIKQGTEFDDAIYAGTLEGSYSLFGMEGNDRLTGSQYGDLINGGIGSDTIYANAGNDEIWGGAGTGSDLIYGGEGSDRIYGQGDYTQVNGEAGDDILVSLNGTANFQGAAGNDQLWGGSANDQLFGGEGNDFVFGGGGYDLMSGDNGDDTLVKYTGSADMYGGVGNDQLWASSGNDYLDGYDGNDYLNAGSGNNSLYGGNGNDVLISGEGTDVLEGGAGNDTLWAGAGNDNLKGTGTLTTYVDANGVTRYQTNVSQVDYLYGESGHDVLTGGNGRNLLVGGEGNDTLWAGGVYSSVAGAIKGVRGDVDVSDFLWGGTGDDVLVANGGDYLYGEDGSDTLRSVTGANTLNGGAGSDYLYGGDTSSNLFGGIGNDSMTAGAASDKLYGGEGDDYLAANGGDTLYGEAGSDFLFSTDGSNTLIGGEGADFFRSSTTGTDHLWGGAGFDSYELTGNGKYIVHEDSSGGVVQLSAQFRNNMLVAGRLLNDDQLYLRFMWGADITISGWAAGNVRVQVDQTTYTSTEVMAMIPTILNKYYA